MNSTTLKETTKASYSTIEAFKKLRTNFLFSGTDIKTVVITSCVKNEGKSTISIELAKSLAEAEKKVLFIDADLRKSIFASKYTENKKGIIGLSEYLSGQTDKESILYSTQFPNLTFVFAGAVPPNSVELVGSTKFEALVKEMREVYDYIIIDAPPLGAVIDAAVISSFCDGAIMIVTANKISYRFATEVKKQLEKSGCRILGAILNNVSTRPGSYYNRYYNSYYGNYKKYGYEGYGYGHKPDNKKDTSNSNNK